MAKAYQSDDTIKGIIKALEAISTSSGERVWRVWRDFVRVALAVVEATPRHLLHLRLHGCVAEDTEDVRALWEEVRGRYGNEAFTHLTKALKHLQAHAREEDMSGVAGWDIVGLLYMRIGWADTGKGQFFTPWGVSRLMAQLVIHDSQELLVTRVRQALEHPENGKGRMVLEGLERAGEAVDGWWRDPVVALVARPYLEPVTACDPCVGSGTNLLALASCVEPHLRFVLQLHGQDIDPLCVDMTKLNLGLYGLSSQVVAVNSLDAEAVKEWLETVVVQNYGGHLLDEPQKVEEVVEAVVKAATEGDEERLSEVSQNMRSWQQGSLF